MTHYRLTDSTPSAIILARNSRTSSLDELKAYQGNDIFLNNKDEFQIRLFNPLTDKIGVQVSINGKSSSRLLVLNPGEDVVVDRFIDEQRRMIFETYQYDDGSQSARNAVANNGIIELKFFKEFFPADPTWNSLTTTNFGFSGGTNPPSTLTRCGTSGTYVINTDNVDLTANNVFQCSNNLDFVNDDSKFKSAGIYVNEPDCPRKRSRKMSKSIKSLKETGRVSKGVKSAQNFQDADVQFETFSFHIIVYHLKPISEKNSYSKEVREYCTTCGYRLRNDKWSYCPKCGERV